MVSYGCERTYIFRGKRLDNDEWIQGYLFEICGRSYICWGTTIDDIPNMVEVDPETVSQYVMGDDMNKNKLFEGDIVRTYIRHPKYGWKVLVESRTGVICDRNTLIDGRGGFHKPQDTIQLELVGNIWDNVDLLDYEMQRWIDKNYRRKEVGEMT